MAMRGFTHKWHSLCPSPWHWAPGRGYWEMNINSPSAQVRARSQGPLFVEELHVKYHRCNTLHIKYYFIWSIKGMARPLGSHCYPQGGWASHQRANAHQYKEFNSHRSLDFLLDLPDREEAGICHSSQDYVFQHSRLAVILKAWSKHHLHQSLLMLKIQIPGPHSRPYDQNVLGLLRESTFNIIYP